MQVRCRWYEEGTDNFRPKGFGFTQKLPVSLHHRSTERLLRARVLAAFVVIETWSAGTQSAGGTGTGRMMAPRVAHYPKKLRPQRSSRADSCHGAYDSIATVTSHHYPRLLTVTATTVQRQQQLWQQTILSDTTARSVAAIVSSPRFGHRDVWCSVVG